MRLALLVLFYFFFANKSLANPKAYSYHQEKQIAEKALSEIESELQKLEGLNLYSHKAIEAIIQKAVRNLKLKGSWRLAGKIEKDWAQFHKTYLSQKSIGDFAPFHQWLSDAYEQIESELGYPHCYSERISDLKTINHGLKVVSHPCAYGYDEFFKHFASDDPKYRSLLPVVSYWATLLGCYAGTYGSGLLIFCGNASLLVESIVDTQLAPYLAPQIYKAHCR